MIALADIQKTIGDADIIALVESEQRAAGHGVASSSRQSMRAAGYGRGA